MLSMGTDGTSKLWVRLVSLLVTSRCPLKCKLCIQGIPYHTRHEDTPVYVVKKMIKEFFEIYDFVERFDVMGGEGLLHPDLAEILDYLGNFSEHFGMLRIVTSSTVPMKTDVVQSMKKLAKVNKGKMLIDDYGSLSKYVDELISQCKENNIPYQVDCYAGEEQFCNGWVDAGEQSDRHYTQSEVRRVYGGCHPGHYMCIVLCDGKLFPCSRFYDGFERKAFECVEDDYVDLLNENEPLRERVRIAGMFGNRINTACYYCNGFDPENSPRFPAAEQL